MTDKYKTWDLDLGEMNSMGFTLCAKGTSVPLNSLPIKVIETQAVDDLQAKLDVAKDYIERLIYSCHNPLEMDFDAVVLNAEKFLREVENEST